MTSSGDPTPAPAAGPPPDEPEPCWSTGAPPNAFAALPRGRAGRLGAVLLRFGNAVQQRELLGVLQPVLDGGPDVVEIGCGPGVLLRALAGATTGSVIGTDPSEPMRDAASRALSGRIAAGRVRVTDGTAAATGLPDGSADLVVSSNTVAIWPDLDAGVAGLHRLLRPGGALVLSWHGGTAPPRKSRSLTLPVEQTDRIGAALAGRFGNVRSERTTRCTIFHARRT